MNAVTPNLNQNVSQNFTPSTGTVMQQPQAMPSQIMPPQTMPQQMMDPLAQLNDIHLPQAIHQYPIAPGWWLLLFLTLALLSYGAVKLYRYKKRCQVKQQAIATIKNNQLSVADTMATLKWACLSYFPRKTVAPLHGAQFQSFLTEQLIEQLQEKFTQLMADNIDSLYQEQSFHVSDVEQAALLWLKAVLPTKASVFAAEQKHSSDKFKANNQGAKV